MTGVDVPADRRRRAGAGSARGGPTPGGAAAGVASRPIDRRPAARDRRAASRPARSGPPRARRAVDQRPTSVPIYQTATFTAADAEELGDVLRRSRAGYAYAASSTRPRPPSATALRGARRRGGGLALASGMAAIHAALASRSAAGDRVVAPQAVYGSTRTLLHRTFGRFGVRGRLRRHDRSRRGRGRLAAAPTRVLYAETIANPTTVVADHAALAELAHRHGATYVVDNTFASPYVCRPLELGADLVVESATKYLGGHSDVIAGVVAGRREPHRGACAEVQIDTGATLGPFEAFLVLRGILDARRPRWSATPGPRRHWRPGSSVRTACERVLYPGLPSHPQHAVAARQFRPASAAGCWRSRSPAAARRAGRSSTR